MKQTRTLTGIFAGIGMLLMILDSRTALEGAQTGLELCIRTVIPSLFPFIVLSMLLTSSISGNCPFVRGTAAMLGLPPEAGPVLIPAFLGGYPVGAKAVWDQYRMGKIEKDRAEQLLSFCSNAGPSFLFGMVSGFFPDKSMVWILWLIHMASALLTAHTLLPGPHPQREIQIPPQQQRPEILTSAMKAMAVICGWVILFRILTAFLKRWFLWLLPPWLQVLITGLLELTNGCCQLLGIPDEKLRFLLSSCMLSFGGICILLQTASVTQGLSLGFYVKGKALQTGYAFLLSLAVIWENGWLLTAAGLLVLLFIRKIKKRYGNLRPVPV